MMKHKKDVLKHLYNFENMPLIVTFEIDAAERQKELEKISPEQRKKIYAVMRDITEYTGNGEDYIKEILKTAFIENYGYDDFSLSNCSRELTKDFIEFILKVAFKQGVPLKENPFKAFDDIERAMLMCLKYKKCSICGRHGEVHHVDHIGMGFNRHKKDDSDHRKICLCRIHHTEAHNIGWEEFEKKYYIKGVIYNV